MKLLVAAALIAVASAARLEHLERGYLPPSGGSQGNYGANAGVIGSPNGGGHASFGLNDQVSQYGGSSLGSNGFGSSGSNGFGGNGAHGSNGFGGNGARGSNGFGGNGAHGSNGFGANRAHSSNGFGGNGAHGSNGAARGSNGFGSNGAASARNSGADAATSNQYLPPNREPGTTNGANSFGSSIRPACSTCGSSNYGTAPQRYSSQQQPQSFGSQGLSIPSTQYGTPQFGTNSFGSRPSFGAQQNQLPNGGASNQYLAPKSSAYQDIPQQPFDEQTGYHY